MRSCFHPLVVHSDEVAQGADRPDQLYLLRPAATAGGLQSADAAAAAGPDAAAGASVPWIMLPSQRELFLNVLATAAQQAISHTPTFDVLKLR